MPPNFIISPPKVGLGFCQQQRSSPLACCWAPAASVAQTHRWRVHLAPGEERSIAASRRTAQADLRRTGPVACTMPG